MAMSRTKHKPNRPAGRMAGPRAAAPLFTAVHAMARPPVARAGLMAFTGV